MFYEPKKESEIKKTSVLNTPNILSNPNIATMVATSTIRSSDVMEYEKFREHFEKLFTDSNLPGPDYFEFQKMIDAMAELPDNSKFSAAFSGLKIQGLTKEKLISTGTQYINIIENDAKNFVEAIDKKMGSDIEAGKTRMLLLEKMATDKTEMINSLQIEIEAHKKEAQSIKSEVIDNENKINDKMNAYKSACEAKKNEISSNLNKINTYIK